MVKWITLDYKSPSNEELGYLNFFNQFVVDQNRAKEKISAKLAAYRHGVIDKNKPAGILFFPGPSGVGKTYLVSVFAKLLIGSFDGFTRIDCSNFQESHTIARLLGSPPGYVGYKDEPELCQSKLIKPWLDNHPEEDPKEEQKKLNDLNLQFMEIGLEIRELQEEMSRETRNLEKNKIARDIVGLKKKQKEKEKEINTFIEETRAKLKDIPSILLFDEIEKIHPEITKALLPIFDIGETKLASGEKVNFRNCFIFMTSNIGSKKIANMLSGKGLIGFCSDSQKKQENIDLGTLMYETIMAEIMNSNHFPTELVGRIGKENIVIFHPLSSFGIKSIINLKLSDLQNKILAVCPNTKIIFSQDFKDLIFEETQDPLNRALGARPIENVIKTKIMEPLLNLIIKSEDGGIIPGDFVRIHVEEIKGKKKIVIQKAENKNGVDIFDK